MSSGDSLGPATFGDLREAGQWMHQLCACGHEREVDLTVSPWSAYPDATVVPTFGKSMTCTACKQKGKVWSAPEISGASRNGAGRRRTD